MSNKEKDSLLEERCEPEGTDIWQRAEDPEGFNSKTDDPLAGFSAVPESLCAGICSHAPLKDTGDTEKIIVVVQHEN